MTPGRTIRHDRGGRTEGPPLLLLHGLGATGAVWDEMVALAEERWSGGWVVPDLAGHGGSDPADIYSFGQHAADVAGLVKDGGPVTVVGHSMGGVVALALASGWFGVQVERAVGVGIKVSWTQGEVDRARTLADKPVKWFERRDEAEAFFLRVAGLEGLTEPGGPLAARGVREQDGRYRLAADPRTAMVGPPPMRTLAGAASGPFRLACGERDGLVSVGELRAFDPGAVELEGLGHNAHVEDPAKVFDLLQG